jgi:parallel beta-helix repeat protein
LKYWNTHIIDTTNTVNGKPVHYWKNQTGGTVPPGAGQVILANSTNVVLENQNLSDGSVGIELGFSSNITIANNTGSSNYYASIFLYSSNNSAITNNFVSNNDWWGIHLQFSNSNTIANNTVSSNNRCGIILMRNSDDNIILSNNILSNNRYGIGLYYSSINNTIAKNNILFNYWSGIHLYDSFDNIILSNTISDNDYGIYLQYSAKNRIYHNSIINNINQAYDDRENNFWNDTYPSGGNYWSDYSGIDNYKGPNQTIPGRDGIGDKPYTNIQGIGGVKDYYPLMVPYKPLENYLILKQGWNLVSIPITQAEQNPTRVLGSIDGWYDAVQCYAGSTDKNDPWKHQKVGKPFGNDLKKLNETMGLWIHITQPGDTIFLYNGTIPTQNQTITLHPGWNMVGYPSLRNYNRTNGLNNLTFGQEVDSIWTYDAATQKWEEIGSLDYFELGRGYWIHVKTTCMWEVPL